MHERTEQRKQLVVLLGVTALSLVWLLHSARAADEKWTAETVAEAILAAPPPVTETATVYGWDENGKLTLARSGTGPYTCVSSGAFSLRMGKPPLPYPDPMCMDQNAWAFLQAVWSEKNPIKPEKPYPTAPGLVWMLAGMNVDKGAVMVGASEVAVIEPVAGAGGGELFQMSPHVMVMPLPVAKSSPALPIKYDLHHPLGPWIMAAGTPYEHLMMHFSAEDVAAIMQGGE